MTTRELLMAIAEEHMTTIGQLASRFNKPRWLVEEKIRILLKKGLLGINYDTQHFEMTKDKERGSCGLKCRSCSKDCVGGFTADIKIFSLTEKGCEFIYGRRERNAKK